MTEVKQKINLYLPRFQPETLSREVKKLFLLLLITIGVLAVVIITIVVINTVVSRQIAEENRESEVLNSALEEAISKIPNVTPDINLITRIKKEKISIKKKQQVIAYLYQDTLSEGEGFTHLVDQLSQKTVDGIWLKKFEILNKGNSIQLFGYAKSPGQVTSYIEMLSSRESYKGRSFQQIKINKSTNGWHDFYISTLSLDELLVLDAAEVDQ